MKKRAYRNTQEKVIAGVCSGLADYFSIDPLYIRILFLLLLFKPPFAFIVYIGLWIAIPARTLHLNAQDDSYQNQDEESFEKKVQNFAKEAEAMGEKFGKEVETVADSLTNMNDKTRSTINVPTFEKPKKRKGILGGMILIALGLLFLANNFLPDFDIEMYWPIILIAIGISILFSPRSSKEKE